MDTTTHILFLIALILFIIIAGLYVAGISCAAGRISSSKLKKIVPPRESGEEEKYYYNY